MPSSSASRKTERSRVTGSAAAPAAGAADASARKGDLHNNAVQALRTMIVTGELAPGERLNERELCARLNVSRTPIREAIKTLAQDGLLQVWPNRSPVVMPLEAAHTAALVEVVATIEALAGELCASRITDAQVAELGILHYTMLRHHADQDLRAYFAANKAFHRLIIECSGNPVLTWVWDLLALRVDRARYSSNLRPERWRQAIQEHAQVLERMTARDPQGVADALRSHLRAGLSLVVQTLVEAERSAPSNPGDAPG
ncbi:MAG: GntR family transcriptional regulator [Betaproteobacteria bacterium]|jgi:DNA-binding GntR family transcriptional regulator